MRFDIPNFKECDIENIIFDYNGTIATDGIVEDSFVSNIKDLAMDYNIYVVTADTFGSVKKNLSNLPIDIKVLDSNDHTKQKCDILNSLGADKTIAVGNGNNDRLMLQEAIISIAILGKEGLSTKALNSADIVCKSITDALMLIKNQKRLIATLRR